MTSSSYAPHSGAAHPKASEGWKDGSVATRNSCWEREAGSVQWVSASCIATEIAADPSVVRAETSWGGA
jgi:hypothetical protein